MGPTLLAACGSDDESAAGTTAATGTTATAEEARPIVGTPAGPPGAYRRGMLLRLVLGALFAAMGVAQLASWSEMPDIIGSYQLAEGSGATALAAALIAGELVAGVWLLARPRSRGLAPAAVFAAVSLTWAGLAAQAYARGLEIDNCGCFGAYLAQRLGPVVLAQDALLLIYAALLVRGARRSPPRPAAAGPRPRELT